MSLRASMLAVLTAKTTLAAGTADAGGLSPNLSIRAVAIDGAIMTGRHPIIGYGPAFVSITAVVSPPNSMRTASSTAAATMSVQATPR